jgi:4-amino-4-deoxy-L-arabinose transferase-like glycosyltransferase
MDLEGDEAIYAGIVERMLAGASWASPPDENGPFLEKPPLRSWIVAATMAAGLLRPTEGGHRAVDAFMGAGALLYVFFIAHRLGGLAAGVGAVFLAIAQSQLLFVHGLRSGTMEPLLVLAYCGAMAHFLSWAEGRGKRHAYAVAGWVAAAILAKFVAAAPLLVILLAALVIVPPWRARARADARTWSLAAALCALLVVPWFAYQTAVHGTWFWKIILGVHVIARAASFLDPAHVKPWWYYPTFIVDDLRGVWVYVAAGALAMAWQARARKDPSAALVALWLVVPVAMFSLSTSKLGHYMHPATPALAVAGGQAFGAFAALARGIGRRDVLSPRLRSIAAHVAAIALVAALLIAVELRRSVAIGGKIYGPYSPAPAALIGVAALIVVLGRGRAAATFLVGAMIVTDVGREYGRAVTRARAWGRHQGALADCVRARLAGRPAAFHVHADRGLGHDEKYYFRRVGLSDEPEPDPERLASLLRSTTEPRVITVDQYRRVVPAMAAWPPDAHAAVSVAVLPHRGLVVFLPGEMRPCAAATRRIP